jgi:hypothetical protein
MLKHVPARVIALVALFAAGILGCGSGSSSGGDGSASRASRSGQPGPAVAFESIQLVPGGGADLVIELSHVPLPRTGTRGAIVEFHPNDQPVSVQLSGRGITGSLMACPVGGDGTRTGEPCVAIRGSQPVQVRLNQANGSNHVGLELAGSSKGAITLEKLEIGYRAVDYFLNVEFPPIHKGA